MAFRHNETTATKKILQYTNWKWSYVDWGLTLKWHLKPVWIDDRTFNVEGIAWSVYKFTIKWIAEVKESDKLTINNEVYVVKWVKEFKGISFNTTKILLAKK